MMVVFGVYLLYQNFLVTFVSISDNLLSLSVMITIIFSVRFPELGLFLVELSLVVLLLLLLLALAVQIRPHVLFLFSSEFLVLGVLLLLSRFLKTHVLVDLHLFLLDHLFLFLHDSVVLLIDELESFLFTTGQFFLTRFFLFVQQSAIILLGFNIPLFFLVLSDHGNMLVDFVFFFESFEMLDALDLPLQLETLGLLFFLLDPMDQNGVQLFLSFFFHLFFFWLHLPTVYLCCVSRIRPSPFSPSSSSPHGRRSWSFAIGAVGRIAIPRRSPRSSSKSFIRFIFATPCSISFSVLWSGVLRALVPFYIILSRISR